MSPSNPQRLLSIGEFSAATQLTPKALRLYDDHGLMRPATVDRSNGYRYYHADQVATGRLIRTLREMDLSLAQIAEIVAAGDRSAELLLWQFSFEQEQRYAREKRAFQAALAMMRHGGGSASPVVEEHSLPEHIDSVWSFSSDRARFAEHYFEQKEMATASLLKHGLTPSEPCACVLIDPLTDDEGRLELLVPITTLSDVLPPGITSRHMPPRRYATVTPPRSAEVVEFTAAVDLLFDWFDRRSCQALDHPLVTLLVTDEGVKPLVAWAFESSSSRK